MLKTILQAGYLHLLPLVEVFIFCIIKTTLAVSTAFYGYMQSIFAILLPINPRKLFSSVTLKTKQKN